ncbi:dihydrolipoyl dehydrogenase [Neobacillus sp. D3-1R]|uniref:dihydrolipoyl dehydrogenase n=1 Tax=Neobacillus sp. D3-1R TaxID=3445778 RepID=UPI003FA01F52
MVVGELAYEKDLVIIGGGPGGYHAAIRAAQLGLKVTLIEKEKLGGVCLNEGCIPSKILTSAASRLNLLRDSEEMGIGSSQPTFQYEKLRNYQQKVIDQLRNGVQSLIQANKIELVKGNAYFLSDDRIGVEGNDQYEVYQFKKAIIATGTQQPVISGVQIDGNRIFHTKMLQAIPVIPKHLLIYGHNEIALEMASSFHSFGSEVTILLDKENFGFDSSIEKELKRVLKKKKIQILKNAQLMGVQYADQNLLVELQIQDEKISLNGTHLLISTSGVPNTRDLGIERIGVSVNESRYIQTNKQCQTTVPNIYAVGDVADGPAIAVKAISQGKMAAESIAGKLVEFDPNFLPKVVHFQPPIASVGLTEEEAVELGMDVKMGQFPLASNGYATILGKKDGLVKIISDSQTDTLLGVHMMGEGAIELISSGVLSLEMVAREEDLRFPFYPHPSINEGMLEAIEALNGEAVHMPPKKNSKKELIK